jgi:hypothetical protein
MVKLQSVLGLDAAAAPYLEVLRSLAIRFWNQTCNQKYNYNLAQPASCLALRLQGLSLLGLPFWNQTCKQKVNYNPC